MLHLNKTLIGSWQPVRGQSMSTMLRSALVAPLVLVTHCTPDSSRHSVEGPWRTGENEPASSATMAPYKAEASSHCDSEAALEQWLAARPLARAVSELKNTLEAVARAQPNRQLKSIRSLAQALKVLANKLSESSPTELHQPLNDVPLPACLPDRDERKTLYQERLRDSGFVETTSNGWHLTPELTRLSDVLHNFLELDLLRAPAPDSCSLPQDPSSYEWNAIPLRQAHSELVGAPSAVLHHLRKSVADEGDSLLATPLAALPGAACEQLDNLVCHHLKRARVIQPKPEGLPALRRRARSLASVETPLTKLRRRSEQLGCGSTGLGSGDTQRYASQLVDDATNVFLDLDRVRVEWFLSRDKARSPQDSDETLKAEALNYLRVSRLETAALAIAVVEPALTHLQGLDKALSQTQQQWQDVLSALPLSSAGTTKRIKHNDLAHYEDFLAVLLKRPAEVCELASSPFALNTFPTNGGLHAQLGRKFSQALRSRCQRTPRG